MLPIRDCHPLWSSFPTGSGHIHGSAGPRSLATTRGVSIDFLSSGYLDVSVPRVRFLNPMYSGQEYLVQPADSLPEGSISKLSGGLPHSEIAGSKPILGSPKLIAEYHVLHRLLLPRHPPNALLALDLIQKKTGPRTSRRTSEVAGPLVAPATLIKSILSRIAPWFVARRVRSEDRLWLVYLTWKLHACWPLPSDRSPTRDGPHATDVYLSERCE